LTPTVVYSLLTGRARAKRLNAARRVVVDGIVLTSLDGDFLSRKIM